MITEPDCDFCKVGLEKLRMTKLFKVEHSISRKTYRRYLQDVGQKCALCVYNGIKGLTGRAYRKAIPNFQSLDLFEEIDNEDDRIEMASLIIELEKFA